MDPLINGLHIAILVTDGFEKAALTAPKEALEREGAITKIVSDKRGKVQSGNQNAEADQFDIDLSFEEVDPKDFDAIVLSGGTLSGDRVRSMLEAQNFVRGVEEEGKPIGAVGRGVWLLLSTGLVQGRTLTSLPEMQDELRTAGANWVDQDVVVDGNWISARNPEDLPAFNQRLIDVLSERMQSNLRGKADEHAVGIASS